MTTPIETDRRIIPPAIERANWDYIDIANAEVLHTLHSWGHVLYVIGNPGNGSYEWCVMPTDSQCITARSNVGCGDPLVSLRDGLNFILG